MSIIDKMAKRRGETGKSSLVERAMSRQTGAVDDVSRTDGATARVQTPEGAAPAPGAERPEAAESEVPPQRGLSARAVEDSAAARSRVEKAHERKTSLSFRLNWDDLQRKKLIGHTRHAKRLQSEMRTIKSRLMSAINFFDFKRGARGRGGENVILVTSARQGEGKSFLSINLALSLALEDQVQVLLVDADAEQNSVSQFFGLGRDRAGLLDRLSDPKMDLSRALLRAEGTTLSVLPAGRRKGSSVELYGGPAMSKLLEEISNRYPDRLIIFDSPPLLATNEPMVLGTQIQQVLLVVEAGKTTEATVRATLDILGRKDRVSLVLNQCTIKADEVQSTSYGYGADAVMEKTSPKGREAA